SHNACQAHGITNLKPWKHSCPRASVEAGHSELAQHGLRSCTPRAAGWWTWCWGRYEGGMDWNGRRLLLGGALSGSRVQWLRPFAHVPELDDWRKNPIRY